MEDLEESLDLERRMSEMKKEEEGKKKEKIGYAPPSSGFQRRAWPFGQVRPTHGGRGNFEFFFSFFFFFRMGGN